MSIKLITHKVLRAIWIGGERIEPGSLVDLGPVLGAELRTAGKVERHEGEGEAAASAADPSRTPATEPAPKVRKPAKPAAEAAE
ncbi:MAG: hypothetical protein ACOVPA_19830 [Rubrivivax sp.]|jgi:hypothetical protein